MRNDTIDRFLEALAAQGAGTRWRRNGGAAPGRRAALVAMVARYTTGPRYAEHAAEITHGARHRGRLRERALDLAEGDVGRVHRGDRGLPAAKGTEGEAAQRSRAIAEAVRGAARPPADVVTAAADRCSGSPRGCCRWATAA